MSEITQLPNMPAVRVQAAWPESSRAYTRQPDAASSSSCKGLCRIVHKITLHLCKKLSSKLPEFADTEFNSIRKNLI